jgi:drug/metabolite transporter (DMT)-like permease
MIIILKPGMQQLDMGAIWILLSVFAWSSSDVVTKKLGKTETVYSQTFYTTLFGSIIASSVAAFDTYEPIMVDDLFLLFLLGLLLILQIISIFKTFQHADFSVVMPFDYFRLPLTSLTSYLMFQEVMSLDTLIGSIIIISGGFYLVYHERKKHYYAMHH